MQSLDTEDFETGNNYFQGAVVSPVFISDFFCRKSFFCFLLFHFISAEHSVIFPGFCYLLVSFLLYFIYIWESVVGRVLYLLGVFNEQGSR